MFRGIHVLLFSLYAKKIVVIVKSNFFYIVRKKIQDEKAAKNVSIRPIDNTTAYYVLMIV